jgi:hypothetical protein
MGKTFSTGLLTNGIWQDASNNVGIGAAPSGSYKLEVTGTAKVSSTLLVSGSVTSDDLILTAGTLFGAGNTGFSNRSSDTTLYLQMPATGFNITDNALNTKFILSSTGAATFYSRINGVVGGTLYNTAGLWLQGSSATDGMAIGGTAGGDKNIDTYGGTLKINATSGNGLIVAGGTSLAYASAVSRLSIDRSGSVARIQNYDGGSAAAISFAWDGGNVLIGKTNAGVANSGLWYLSSGETFNTIISSNNTLHVYDITNSVYRFYVSGTGTINASNTTISAISDVRLKENIVDLEIGLDAIMSLRPRQFDWKKESGNSGKNIRGFIAQEFEQIFPDLIDESINPAPEGEEPYKQIRQDLIPILVKAIQELNERLNKAGL